MSEPTWKYNNDEEKKLAEEIINMEKTVLAKFFNGDMTGYDDLWSKKSFTYYDAVTTKRIDDFATIRKYLSKLEGKLHSDNYKIVDPRVQFNKNMDTAVLTYQLFAKTNINDVEYNCIQVYQKEDEGWKVIHSTWAVLRPMDKDYSKMKVVV